MEHGACRMVHITWCMLRVVLIMTVAPTRVRMHSTAQAPHCPYTPMRTLVPWHTGALAHRPGLPTKIDLKGFANYWRFIPSRRTVDVSCPSGGVSEAERSLNDTSRSRHLNDGSNLIANNLVCPCNWLSVLSDHAQLIHTVASLMAHFCGGA